MRRIVKITAGWIHVTLILAILLPFFYAMGAGQGSGASRGLYFRCLLIAFPVAVTGIAVEKCRGLPAYLLACVLTFAATGVLAWVAAGGLYRSRETESLIFVLFLLGEGVFVAFSRFAGRLNKKREREVLEKEDPNAEPYLEWMKEPSFKLLLFFCLVYALALNMDSPEVCDEALFSAAAYGANALLYHYVIRTERYLSLNKRTCNLPSKRIYGIGSSMLAVFLLLLMVAVLPSFFTVSRRNYRDWRDGVKNWNIDLSGLESGQEGGWDGGAGMDWLDELGEAQPAPVWMELLAYVMEAAVFLFLAFMLVRMVFGAFRDFRGAIDENGDIVEELEEAETGHILRVKARKGTEGAKLAERERIRKQYRKFIRKHRKERPAVYESPAEIETAAGIAQTEERAVLHEQYEYARYGRYWP